MKNRGLWTFTLPLIAGGCASTPPVTVSYYHPQAAVQLTVIQTIGCDSDNQPHLVTTVTPAVSYRADYAARQSLSFARLGGNGANLDAGITLTDDGRLGGINAVQTGIGTEIVNSVLGLVKSLPFAGANGAASQEQTDACKWLEDNGDKKLMTLTFRHGEPFAVRSGTASRAPGTALPRFQEAVATLEPPAGQIERIRPLDAIRGSVCLAMEEVAAAAEPRVQVPASSRRDIGLQLRHPATIEMTIYQVASPDCPEPRTGVTVSGLFQPQDKVWSARVMVPQWGSDYAFPIPRAALFGSQTTKLSLSEAGTPLTITYGRTSGAAAAVNAFAGYAGLAVTTDSQQAAALDAEADVIAQQQRLIRCQTNPGSCPT